MGLSAPIRIKTSLFPLRKKRSFALRISSVNVTKFAVFCGFGHIYWRNPQWKSSLLYSISIRICKIGICKWLYGHFILYNTRHLDGNFKKSTSQSFLIWFFSQLELKETSKITSLKIFFLYTMLLKDISRFFPLDFLAAQHVTSLTKLVKSRRLQNSASLSFQGPEAFTSILIKVSHYNKVFKL